MARITAGITCSHVPAIGAAIDLGKVQEPYWAPLFAGFEFSKRWMASNTPDVVFLVYLLTPHVREAFRGKPPGVSAPA